MKDELITRCYNVELEAREEDSLGKISGRPIVYNSRTDLGWFDEVIEVGALDDADLTDVRLCLNHDTSYVYARSRRNNPNSTMRLTVDQSGMGFEADLALEESPKARDYYSAVKRGDIDKMSFMFSVKEDRWEDIDTDHPTRHITKIGSVVEVSAVTFPAYDATSIQIDARNKEALESARQSLENEKQQRAKELESLELEKLKLQIRNK